MKLKDSMLNPGSAADNDRSASLSPLLGIKESILIAMVFLDKLAPTFIIRCRLFLTMDGHQWARKADGLMLAFII